jgi:hypothetical protein
MSLKKVMHIARTGLVAGTIGLGAIVATAPPSHAAMFERCLAATRYGDYAASRMGSAGTFSEWNFWYTEWSNNDDWISAHC